MVSGIEHVGLCAVDPDFLTAWYVSTLGFRVVHSIPARHTYFVRSPDGGMLEIYPAAHGPSPSENTMPGIRHFGLSVTDLEAEVQRLVGLGVGVPRDTLVSTPEMKLAFFRDPEGNILHLVERSKPIP
jgi:glyoxylase I family protein